MWPGPMPGIASGGIAAIADGPIPAIASGGHSPI